MTGGSRHRFTPDRVRNGWTYLTGVGKWMAAGGYSAHAQTVQSDLHVEPNGVNTMLVGDLDQAALYRALTRILSLGLELVELKRLTARAN